MKENIIKWKIGVFVLFVLLMAGCLSTDDTRKGERETQPTEKKKGIGNLFNELFK